jgi:hypothetical protein
VTPEWDPQMMRGASEAERDRLIATYPHLAQSWASPDGRAAIERVRLGPWPGPGEAWIDPDAGRKPFALDVATRYVDLMVDDIGSGRFVSKWGAGIGQVLALPVEAAAAAARGVGAGAARGLGIPNLPPWALPAAALLVLVVILKK